MGNYPITISGGSDNNYSFNYQSGNLEVQVSTSVTYDHSTKNQIGPNPTTGLLYVSKALAYKTFEIFDLSGSLFMKGEAYNTTIDISELKTGMYILLIDHSKFRIIKK